MTGNNQYESRPKNIEGIETVNVTLASDEPITETASSEGVIAGALATPNSKTVVGTNYNFENLQKKKTRDNSDYVYTVTQEKIPGYETTVGNKANGYTITNTLVLPTYTSQVTYTPINSFQNRYLKNGTVQVVGTVTANSDNRGKSGLNEGEVSFTIDEGIEIDASKLKIKFFKKQNSTTYDITNYVRNGNTITAKFGENANGISEKGDKITIEVQGKLTKIGNYTSNIVATGKLRDYANGTSARGNLGQVTSSTNSIQVDKQLARANVQIQTRDSITKEKLTDATFTVYEWNKENNTYVAKETIRDTNQDGIYESRYYEWNSVSDGRYKIEQTGIPQNHTDLRWSMEFRLNELKQEDYTIRPDYSNSNYTINYGVRNPDNFSQTDGIVENEPWKLKAEIEKVDNETKNIIQNNAIFTIYEWNKETREWEKYNSKITRQPVNMVRQGDIYLSGEWFYYTSKNEGKYYIEETEAPDVYYTNCDENGDTLKYEINIVRSIQTGNYQGQAVQNEATVRICDTNDLKLTNHRQQGILDITVVDSQTKGVAQADSTLEGAKYGIYAFEAIHHPEDGRLLYEANQLIQERTTNEQGKLIFNGLECGKYYVQMREPAEGYLMDEEQYRIDFNYDPDTKGNIRKEKQLEMKVKKQAFQLYKLKENNSMLSNAGFSIYLVSNLSIVKTGKITRVTAEKYQLNDVAAQNDDRIRMKQNADGTYYLKDLVNYYYKIIYAEGEEQTIVGDAQVYHPYNLTRETLVKNYANTPEGETIAEIRTNNNGYMRTPELAYGEYIVIETSVPRNYDVASPFMVTIYEDSRDLQDIRFVIDNDFMSKVKIYTKDTQTRKPILNKTIQYVIKNIETGEYMTQKMWVPQVGYVEYGKPDAPYETLDTGFIITPIQLPIGQYELIEITAGEGYTTNAFEGSSVNGQMQPEAKENVQFEIKTDTAYYTDTYLGSYIIVVNNFNKAVVGNISIKAQGEYVSGISSNEKGDYCFAYEVRNVPNATYEIHAKEEISTPDNQGTKIYSKDEIVGYITTNENGEGMIENLPLGSYYIKEAESEESFALNTETKEVTLSYEGQEVPVVFKNVEESEIRQKIEIIVHNKDAETGELRQGGKYGLYTKEEITFTNINGTRQTIPTNTLLATVINNNGEIRFCAGENIDLPQGKYYIKELEAPMGYVLQEEVVEIDTSRNNNKETILRIEKEILGAKTIVSVQEKNLNDEFIRGSWLELIEKATNEVIQNWQTEGDKKTFRNLKTNTEYVLREVSPAAGYVTAEEITFIIKTNGKIEINREEQEVSTITILARATKLDVRVVDELNGSNVEGIGLQIMNKETGNEMVKWMMQGEPQRIEGLPIGNYTIKEISLPKDSGYVTITDVDFSIQDTAQLQEIVLIQRVSKCEVFIKDELELTKYAEGTKWQIIHKKSEEVADEWVQGNNKHTINRLPIGSYLLKEVEIPQSSGYVTNATIAFEIEDTLETQMVETMQMVSKCEIFMKDELEPENFAEGTKWQILEKETEEVVDEWTQGKEKHEVKKLPIGNYVLKEVEVPQNSGYVTNANLHFEILDTLEVQRVDVVQNISKLEVLIKDELEPDTYAEGTKWQILKKETGEVVYEWTQGDNKQEIKKLPVGNYILKEIELPEGSGYITNAEIDFQIRDTLEIQKLEIIQNISKLEIEVKDELDLGTYAEGTKWQILEKETGILVNEWTQGNKKHEVKKLPIGNYVLKEIKLPEGSGYVTNADRDFTIFDNREVQKLEIMQKVSKCEIIIKDELEPENFAEGTKWQIVKKETEEVVDEWTQGKEKHEIKKLPIGNYVLKQVEIPISSGYVTNVDKNFTIIDTLEVQKIEITQMVSKVEVFIKDELNKEAYAEGTKWQVLEKKTSKPVYEWTQGKDKQEIKKLPIGKYILREIEVPSSSGYVTNEDINFEIQNTLEVQKVETVQMVSKVEILIKDELNKEAYAEGTKWQILDKTTKKVIDEWTQGKDKHEVKKLPIGNYLLKEIEVPKGSGYVTNADKNFSIIDTLEVQKIETVQLVSKVEIVVKDELDPETYAKGTKWQILDKTTKKVVDEWTQGKEEHEVKKLPVGNYVLKEVGLPKGSGYVTIKDVEFRVQNTREIQTVEVKQKVSVLQVLIHDELEYKTYAEGTKWQILDKATGKVVDKWTQGEGKHEVKKLPIGDYVLKEIELPKDSGYVSNADLDFSIKDTLDVQIVEAVQSISRIEILIKDELEPESYAEGTKWQILKKETGEVVDKWVQGKDKYEAKKLPIGNYVLKEMEVPKGSGYVTNADMEFAIKDTLEIQKIDVMQKVSKVEVCIKDELEPKTYAEGTKWQIIEKETEEVIDEWTQKEEKYEIKKLPIGNYVLKELEVPTEKGYVTNVNTDFKVLDTLDVQNITINQEVSKVSIKIVDKKTEENIIGKVEINIVDKETEEIIASTKVEEGSNIRKLEKTEDSYDIERLPIGNYTIIETKIPEEEGYVEYQKIDLEVKDTVNVQITEIQQDVSKLLIKVIDEETKDILPGAKLQIVDKQTKEVIAQGKEDSQEEIKGSHENDKLPSEITKDEKIDNLKQRKLEKEETAEPKETKEIIETKEGYRIERLPIGKYILRQETMDGYHDVEDKEFTIENTSDEQEEEMINTRLICNTQVEKSLEKIILDGVETKVTDAEARKIEIKERKIKQTDLKLQYVIRVSNLGETDIKTGTIVDNLPSGFELVAQESEGWTMKGKKAIYQGYEEEILKPGETREVRIVTKWKNEITNFGDKTNTAELANSSNPYGYEDKNDSNDIGESVVYISVGTGVEIAIITIRIMIIVTIGSTLILCFAIGIRKCTKKNKH